MSQPTEYGIFALALGVDAMPENIALLEYLINEEIGRAGLQDRASVAGE